MKPEFNAVNWNLVILFVTPQKTLHSIKSKKRLRS
jgi:hypothetical protein